MSVITQYPVSNAAHGTLGQLTNPTYSYADDGSYATAAPGKNVSKANEYGTFGFDALIPSGATIDKVQIIYEFYVSTTASVATARVHSLVSGSAQANHDDATEPVADKTVTVDITADRTWTRANLLDGVLTVALEAVQGNSSTAVTFSFDYVKVEVTYTIPPVTFAGIADIAIGTVLSKFNRSIKYTITADIVTTTAVPFLRRIRKYTGIADTVTTTALSLLNRLRKFFSSIGTEATTLLSRFNRWAKVTGLADTVTTTEASLTIAGGGGATPNTRRFKRTGYHRSLQ